MGAIETRKRWRGVAGTDLTCLRETDCFRTTEAILELHLGRGDRREGAEAEEIQSSNYPAILLLTIVLGDIVSRKYNAGPL